MSPRMSAALAAILSLLAGVLAVLNQTAFNFGSHFYAAVTVGLLFLAGIGVPAVTGAGFQALLGRLVPAHLYRLVHTVIVAAVAAGTLALTLNTWSSTAHAIIAGVITLLVGLGFGPEVVGRRA